jgi:UDP-2,4-diacetamido-2,4,6-trideoxy-beta-L-altropyranose hydrolase
MALEFYFRVDASSKIGLGHLYRCLTLASFALEQEIESHFICRDHKDYNYKLVTDSGFQLHLLPSGNLTQLNDAIGTKNTYQDWLAVSPKTDAHQVCKVVEKSKMSRKVIIYDHYGIDSRWEQEVKKTEALLVKISDNPSKKILADIILDQTPLRKPLEYKGLAKSGASILSGAPYALINKKFIALRKKTLNIRMHTTQVKVALVAFGGSDPINLTSTFLNQISSYPKKIKYHVVCGSCNPHIHQVESITRDLIRKGIDVNLHIDTSEMAKLTASADIAIGSAGTACWERAVLGLPSIIVPFENNQLDVARALIGNKAAHVIELGKFKSEIITAMHLLTNSIEVRKTLSYNSSRLCDGEGPNRLLIKLKEKLNERL